VRWEEEDMEDAVDTEIAIMAGVTIDEAVPLETDIGIEEVPRETEMEVIVIETETETVIVTEIEIEDKISLSIFIIILW